MKYSVMRPMRPRETVLCSTCGVMWAHMQQICWALAVLSKARLGVLCNMFSLKESSVAPIASFA